MCLYITLFWIFHIVRLWIFRSSSANYLNFHKKCSCFFDRVVGMLLVNTCIVAPDGQCECAWIFRTHDRSVCNRIGSIGVPRVRNRRAAAAAQQLHLHQLLMQQLLLLLRRVWMELTLTKVVEREKVSRWSVGGRRSQWNVCRSFLSRRSTCSATTAPADRRTDQPTTVWKFFSLDLFFRFFPDSGFVPSFRRCILRRYFKYSEYSSASTGNRNVWPGACNPHTRLPE